MIKDESQRSTATEESQHNLSQRRAKGEFHRVTLARAVLGLENTTSMNVAYPNRTDEKDPDGGNLWGFAPDHVSDYTGKPLKACTADTATAQNYRLVKSIYEAEGSEEKSVPILFDKMNQQIVSNESAEIIRMFNAYADELGSNLNDTIYVHINNRAYKAGFIRPSDTKTPLKDIFRLYNTLIYC